MARHSLRELAYYLALIGGILMIVFSLIGFIGFAIRIPFGMPLRGLYLGFEILPLIFGIVAVVGSRRCSELVWAIVLIVVGYIGGGIGGLWFCWAASSAYSRIMCRKSC